MILHAPPKPARGIFATQARMNLKKGSDEEKREILVELGSKLLFDQKIIRIEAKNEYISIIENYKALKEEYMRIETQNNTSINAITEAFTSVISRWHGRKEFRVALLLGRGSTEILLAFLWRSAEDLSAARSIPLNINQN